MNSNTARALAIAKRDYRAFVKGSHSKDLAAWARNMQSRRLAVNTIRQRVCLVRHWLGIEEDITLPARRNIREGKWFNLEQLRAILSIIPNTQTGRRDFVLITALLITGLRVGQVRTWRWNDFEYKHGFSTTNNKTIFPKVVLEVLLLLPAKSKATHPNNMHLPAASTSEDHIFTAIHRRQQMTERGRDLSQHGMQNQPLSPQEINRRIKRYVRLAGLEPQGISVEALRRTHKRLGEHIIISLVQDILSKRNTSPVRWKRLDRDSRLHGIGRRGRYS